MKKYMIKMGWALVLAGVVLACSSCEPVSTDSDEDTDTGPAVVYSRFNIHYYLNKGKNYASYANYVEPAGHGFLPVNTELTIGAYRRGFKLTAVDTGLDVYVEFKAANMGGMSTEEYIALITSSTPVSHDQLSALDQEGVTAGKAKVGMTKEGVKVAWGYPAKHRTPSLEDNTWLYWRNRFAIITVTFDADGKVQSIVGL